MNAHDQPPPEAALQAWVDGRLDEADARWVDDYLAATPAVAARLQSYRSQNAALRAALHARFPDETNARFRLDTRSGVRPPRAAMGSFARAAALIGAVGLGAVAGGGGVLLAMRDAPLTSAALDPGAALARDAYLAHSTYTTEIRHYVEVAASEAHLLPWLSNRLGEQVSAPDLAAFGFRLIGGRLLPTPDGPAAQLMYDDAEGARLTLYLKVDPDAPSTEPRVEARDDANGVLWSEQGFSYALFAPVERDRLLGAAQLIREQGRL